MTITRQPEANVVWYALSAEETAQRLDVDVGQGLDGGEIERRLAEYGPNELPTEPPPGKWAVARVQLSNPMNIMGDRTNLVFQNTQVTRGSAAVVVTATGQRTQIGQIAGTVTRTKRSRQPPGSPGHGSRRGNPR